MFTYDPSIYPPTNISTHHPPIHSSPLSTHPNPFIYSPIHPTIHNFTHSTVHPPFTHQPLHPHRFYLPLISGRGEGTLATILFQKSSVTRSFHCTIAIIKKSVFQYTSLRGKPATHKRHWTPSKWILCGIVRYIT